METDKDKTFTTIQKMSVAMVRAAKQVCQEEGILDPKEDYSLLMTSVVFLLDKVAESGKDMFGMNYKKSMLKTAAIITHFANIGQEN